MVMTSSPILPLTFSFLDHINILVTELKIDMMQESIGVPRNSGKIIESRCCSLTLDHQLFFLRGSKKETSISL